MGNNIRTRHYRCTRWVEFKTGELLAEEFSDLKDGGLERTNAVKNPGDAEVIDNLKRRLEQEIFTAVESQLITAAIVDRTVQHSSDFRGWRAPPQTLNDKNYWRRP